jgi:hypothetical protein
MPLPAALSCERPSTLENTAGRAVRRKSSCACDFERTGVQRGKFAAKVARVGCLAGSVTAQDLVRVIGLRSTARTLGQ